MARKKALQAESPAPEPTNVDKYMVIKQFKADINNRKIVAKPGEMVVLNDFEYKILKRFLE